MQSKKIAAVKRVVATGLAAAALMASSAIAQQPSTKNGEWPMYTADLKGSKYSPLSQIDASNFSKLEVAWRFKTDNLGPRLENKLEGTPIMIKGVVYAIGGTRRAVVALDAKTGEEKWVYSLDEGKRASRSPRQLSGRGLSYWTDGKGDDRIVYVTIGYQLVELNAHTGQPITTFAAGGVLDMKKGVVIGKDKQIDLEAGEIGLHSTPTVVGDVIIVGSSMAEGLGYRFSTNAKGLVRAFDARTGKQLWRFNTIPYPGQPGNETWEKGSWEWTGNTGVWTQISVDEQAGLVYLPVESPTIDTYGGNRPGDNLYGESLVCVDLKTGVKKWHFQLVHHPLWDHDISSAPLLVDAVIDGKPRKLVAQPTKQAYLYVFDRITGQPIWPMPEKAVPQTDVPGEKSAATQPIPTKPAPYSRAFVTRDDVIDFTPELRAQALENLKQFRWQETPYIPPTMQGKEWLGAINIGNTVGGINWPGASFDPETAIFYGQANNSAVSTEAIGTDYLKTVHPDEQAKNRKPIWEAESPEAGGGGIGGYGAGAGRAAIGKGLQGLPLLKPPYGVLTAIDLNTGDTLFKVPHGDTPDNVRNNPALKGITVPKTGQSGSVGLMVTKTLVVVGDPQVTTTPERGRGAMLRAYDKKTGAQVGEILMPAAQSGSPMTYSVDGRQFIIVAVSGGNYSGEYIAYALPSGDSRNSGGPGGRGPGRGAPQQ
jgi:quinoprotein glucose dehydrogenase